MMKVIRRGFHVLCTILLVVTAVLTLSLVVVRLGGMHIFTVLSGSMEPTYPTGSVIVVKPVDTDTLGEGDVITYLVSDNTLVTHRIAGLVADENDADLIRFRTKGDANNIEDMTLVHPNNVVGSPVFCLPYVGYAVNFIQHPPGTYIAIAAASLIVLLTFLPDLFVKEEEGPKEESSDEKSE